jgi:hypothetical protein
MRYLILDPPAAEYDSLKFDYDQRYGARRAVEQAGRREGS